MSDFAPPIRAAKGIARPTRERLSTINKDGSRRFIHAATPRGRFTSLRGLTGVVLLAAYIALPWIRINGNPAVFFDIANRQFHILGLTLVTQDLWLAFFLITGTAFGLFFVTAIVGRAWCGWACPQTVFLDIARRIERWCEGDAPQRRALDRGPMTFSQTIRRALKNVLYAAFALLLAHVFMSYFVSLPGLYAMVRQSPAEHWSVFLFVFAMAAALLFDLAWFREQFCIIMCPYGRLQSALIDDHTITVGYDPIRGDPRGKKGTPGAGDCVDCLRCVQVCPTGIDIRQGPSQLECIACAACIDACNTVMRKVGRTRGLIRYDSANAFSGKETRLIRPRIILYLVLMLAGATVMSFSMSSFKSTTTSITRMPGAPYFIEDSEVRNQFLVRIINKRNASETFRVQVSGAPTGFKSSGAGDDVKIAALDEQIRPLVVTVPRNEFHTPLLLKVRIVSTDGNFTDEKSLPFLGPSTP